MITHYDLFAGIGGFSLALEEVFNGETIEHIFCEWEDFPTAVLKQHWPNAEYWGDIADLVAHTKSTRPQRRHEEQKQAGRPGDSRHFTVVTGGFPCQPFSHAGRRLGTADERYQWPNMFQVIRNVKPEWVIAENVRGLTTWNDGMVLETVCSDLESEGYEVQPFIIPAVSVNAPHRRDRVWIIANRRGEESGRVSQQSRKTGTKNRTRNWFTPHTRRAERQPGISERIQSVIKEAARTQYKYPDWSRNWKEVALATCVHGMDDGIPRRMDGTTISSARWRQESLKAYGNAIVPQVAMEVFKAIKAVAL